jgi:zinc transport system substrate-binding protein
MKKISLLLSLWMAVFLFVAGCQQRGQGIQDTKEETKKLTVYTTIFPLEDFTKKIGGEFVDVQSIYPPGVDAHSFEPTTKTITEIAAADLFIYSGAGVEGFVEKMQDVLKDEKVTLVKAAEGIDLLKAADEHEHQEEHAHEEEDHHSEDEHAHEDEHHSEDEHAHEDEHQHADGEHAHEEEHNHSHGDYDPHVWLDPVLAISLAENIKNALSEKMPEHKDTFEQNFESLKADLEKLDAEFKEAVAKGKTKYLLVTHAAYGYWEQRYGLEQIAISGLSPTQEPSQKELTEVIEESKEHHLKYVIFEQNVSSKVAEVIQKEIGAETLKLHNLEAVTKEDIQNHEDYFSLMKKNLETIKTAIGVK